MFEGMNQGHFRAYGIPVINIYINDEKLTDWISFKVNWNGMGDRKNYVVRRYIPNITREQAQKQADNIRKSLEQQQFSGSFDCDYFPGMTNDRRIVLYGVGKGLSQIYHLSGITIEGDKDTGIQCSVEFTNILENKSI